MLKEYKGNNPDGTPHFHFTLTQDEQDAGFVVFWPGPIAGTISLDGGVRYDVSDVYVPVKAEHVGVLRIAIHQAHHANGRFLDIPVPDLEDVSL